MLCLQTERLTESLDVVVEALLYHHYMNLADCTPELLLSTHHVTYLGTAMAMTRLIVMLIPVDKVIELLLNLS